MSNIVFIATSLDGYISDKEGGLDWLQSVPNPGNRDLGWEDLLRRIDAIVMGRKTFQTVCSFDCPWPYPKPVFVLSNSLASLPEEYDGKAEIINGTIPDILANIHGRGHRELYIDGGVTIQNFLKEDLVDEMIISVLPVLLGGGSTLFGELAEPMDFEHVKTEVLLDAIAQTHYRRRRHAGTTIRRPAKHIEHVAIWTTNLEQLKAFYESYFEAQSGEQYVNPTKGFQSYFLHFASGARLELMSMPSIPQTRGDIEQQFMGIIHLAFAVDTEREVDLLTERLERDGYRIVEGPRRTGDGCYESVVFDPDGNRIEITA